MDFKVFDNICYVKCIESVKEDFTEDYYNNFNYTDNLIKRLKWVRTNSPFEVTIMKDYDMESQKHRISYLYYLTEEQQTFMNLKFGPGDNSVQVRFD